MWMIFFEKFITAVEVTIIVYFLIKYLGFKKCDRNTYLGVGIMWGLSFLSIGTLSWYFDFEIYSTLLQIILNLIFAHIFLDGALHKKIFISIFMMALVALSAGFISILFSMIFQRTFVEIITVLDSVRVTALLFSKLFLFQSVMLVLRIKSKQETLARVDIIPLIVLPLLSVITICFTLETVFLNPSIQEYALYATCIVAVINVATYYLFHHLAKAKQLQDNYALLELQYDYEKKSFEGIQEIYENISRIQHDNKNHLLCILGLACSQNLEQVVAYTQAILDNYDVAHNNVRTNNQILDIVLNTKFAAAQRQGVQCYTGISNALTFMNADDICVLLGNLLDNAMEAARISADKKIIIAIHSEGNFVRIQVNNSISESVLERNPLLLTSKQNASFHGIGIKNIRKIVGEYQGIVEFSEADGFFVASIFLPDRTNEAQISTNSV